MATMTKSKQLKVTLTKSRHGRLQAHRDTLTGLGLRKIRHSVTVSDTPEIRGMINRVSHLVSVEEV
jgi:large subunit ribosomal protein L30